jgi:predicted metal-dependent hydrolase
MIGSNLDKERSETHELNFGSKVISFSVLYRKRKTLAISVHPDASVCVIAPEGQQLTAIKGKVLKRAPWILKQKRYFSEFLPKQPAKKFVTGETHRYLGKQYRLKVIKASSERVSLKGRFLTVYCTKGASPADVKRLLTRWYRERAEDRFQKSLNRCFESFAKFMVEPPQLKVRRMSKRWGSCIQGTIVLNPELVKASTRCIDYVVMHELCHLRIMDHSTKFYNMLTKLMPDWKEQKHKLETSANH